MCWWHRTWSSAKGVRMWSTLAGAPCDAERSRRTQLAALLLQQSCLLVCCRVQRGDSSIRLLWERVCEPPGCCWWRAAHAPGPLQPPPPGRAACWPAARWCACVARLVGFVTTVSCAESQQWCTAGHALAYATSLRASRSELIESPAGAGGVAAVVGGAGGAPLRLCVACAAANGDADRPGRGADWDRCAGDAASPCCVGEQAVECQSGGVDCLFQSRACPTRPGGAGGTPRPGDWSPRLGLAYGLCRGRPGIALRPAAAVAGLSR